MNIGIYDHDIYFAQNLAHKLSNNCPASIHFKYHSLAEMPQTAETYDMIISEKIRPNLKKPQIKLNKYTEPCVYGKQDKDKSDFIYYRFGEPGLLAEYIINHENTRHHCLLRGNQVQIIYLPFAQSEKQIWTVLQQTLAKSDKMDTFVIPLYPQHLAGLEKHGSAKSFKNSPNLSSLLSDLMNNKTLNFNESFYSLSNHVKALREIDQTADLFPTQKDVWQLFIEKLLAFQNQQQNTNLIFIIAQMPIHYFKSLFQKADQIYLVNNNQEQAKMTESIFHHLDIHSLDNTINLGEFNNGERK